MAVYSLSTHFLAQLLACSLSWPEAELLVYRPVEVVGHLRESFLEGVLEQLLECFEVLSQAEFHVQLLESLLLLCLAKILYNNLHTPAPLLVVSLA